MAKLTISTHRYRHILESFASRPDIGGQITRRKGLLFSVNCLYLHNDINFTERLMALITEIALLENPVYKYSAKLRDMAKDLQGTPLYTQGLSELSYFLKHSRLLHLEGYAAFRMSKYREKLDIMSYSLIKKMKLIQQD